MSERGGERETSAVFAKEQTHTVRVYRATALDTRYNAVKFLCAAEYSEVTGQRRSDFAEL